MNIVMTEQDWVYDPLPAEAVNRYKVGEPAIMNVVERIFGNFPCHMTLVVVRKFVLNEEDREVLRKLQDGGECILVSPLKGMRTHGLRIHVFGKLYKPKQGANDSEINSTWSEFGWAWYKFIHEAIDFDMAYPDLPIPNNLH